MGDYESEIARLQKMFEDVPTDAEDLSGDDHSVADPNFEEVSDHETDSEEDISDEVGGGHDEAVGVSEVENEDVTDGETRQKYYVGRDGTQWRRQCPQKNVRTRQENLISHLPAGKPYAKDARPHYNVG